MTKEDYMKLAVNLAKQGCGFTNPNPMVGAIIVKNNKIIGEGYHERCGALHAERNALLNCCEPPKDSTMYVTLEPCCHTGKTPPCTEAIIKSGISHVVIGSCDPNPLVSGKGIKELRKNNIKVTQGVLEKECDELNYVFFHYIKTKTPYVVMKYAMTMDGKIATKSGKSKWITSKESRERVHKDRHRYSSIMVGVGTILCDDPLLTCRLDNTINPIRIICDTNLRTPLNSKVVTTTSIARTIIATCNNNSSIHQSYKNLGCEILVVPSHNGHVDLTQLTKELGKLQIDSVFLEGGSTLNWPALESGIVNKVQTYIAPKVFGGTAKSPVEGTGIELPSKSIKLSPPLVTVIGNDILLESEVDNLCLQE